MSGFSLLEALITAIVLAVGLLGMAGLQGRTLGSNHSSYLRSQAVIMAYDMMDRMRANRQAAAVNGNYSRAFGDSAPTKDCETSACSSSDMADADEMEWVATVQTLPGGDGAYSVNAATGVATVSVRWDDMRTGNTGDYQTFTVSTML